MNDTIRPSGAKTLPSRSSGESPKFVRLSLAAAITLGLQNGLFFRDARLGCLNVLLSYADGCRGSCAYCGLSERREGPFHQKSFIRVDWPLYPLERVVARLASPSSLERICLSMIVHPRATGDCLEIVRRLKEATSLPLSLLLSPAVVQPDDMRRFREAGAQMAGVAIDCATEALFERHRGGEGKTPHHWSQYWRVLQTAVETFGRGRVGCHLVCGLGETEREMLETVQRVKEMGGRTHLFSFYPEPGSALESRRACHVPHYRRVQLGRHLIDRDLSRVSNMAFDEAGRVREFGLPPRDLQRIIRSGTPFETSGCPGATRPVACNRPYGDGPPRDIRSYPFPLAEQDRRRVRRQLQDYR